VPVHHHHRVFIWHHRQTRCLPCARGPMITLTKPAGIPTELRLVGGAGPWRTPAPLKWENLHLKKQLHRRYGFANMVGTSDGITRSSDLIRKVADTDSNVLILANPARQGAHRHAIHYKQRPAGSPLIPVNCAAIPEELLESELFGHERGAFTTQCAPASAALSWPTAAASF